MHHILSLILQEFEGKRVIIIGDNARLEQPNFERQVYYNF